MREWICSKCGDTAWDDHCAICGTPKPDAQTETPPAVSVMEDADYLVDAIRDMLDFGCNSKLTEKERLGHIKRIGYKALGIVGNAAYCDQNAVTERSA